MRSVTLIVSGNQETISWCRWQGIKGITISYLDDQTIESLSPGDRVVGSLPYHVVAKLTQNSIHYDHISLGIPAHLRGQTLTAEELDEYAEIRRYIVYEERS